MASKRDPMPDDVMPHCMCEVCKDHRMRIRIEVARLREEDKSRDVNWRAALRRIINDQSSFGTGKQRGE